MISPDFAHTPTTRRRSQAKLHGRSPAATPGTASHPALLALARLLGRATARALASQATAAAAVCASAGGH